MDLSRRFSIKRVGGTASERVLDCVAAEEPLAILVSHWFKHARVTQNLAVTMRTPGHDRELAAGLLLSEGVIRGRADIADIRLLGSEQANEILIELGEGVDFEAWRLARNGFVSSSCGVCGKRSREAMAQDMPLVKDVGWRIDARAIDQLPLRLRERQEGFAATGGLHAAALATAEGTIEQIFEDIGRHNALDKLIGHAVMDGRLPLNERIIFMSSRGSFELVQKAAMAGASVLATVGGPSSLAIETARDLNLTLIGFVRDGRFNIYAGDWRINS